MKITNVILIVLFLVSGLLVVSPQTLLVDPGKTTIIISPTIAPTVKPIQVTTIPILPLLEKERSGFQELLLQNPNYFGDEPALPLAPVTIIKTNTKYEELTRVAFLPAKDLLHAYINIMQAYGYNGTLCRNGSYEYVRFYADLNSDGDFTDAGEDLGVSNVNVHDIPSTTGPCLTYTKPLSYTVMLKINPKKFTCSKENLIKVRAILAWGKTPPANTPLYNPVWGNVKDAWIQVKPVYFLSIEAIKDKLEYYQYDALSKQYYQDLVPADKPVLSAEKLKSLYIEEKQVTPLRYDFAATYNKIKPYLEDPKAAEALPETVTSGINPKFKSIYAEINPELLENPHVRFEQLTSVGLHYDYDTLSAALTIKSPCGYSGDLCSRGSFEYVAFWMYIYDKIEQMCYWRYVGTSELNVHDIRSLPREGLEYTVNLPANLIELKKSCESPVVLKVRAILSWAVMPPTNNPYYLPVWGNRKDTLIQLKPGNYQAGEHIPYISTVGGMLVENISGNSMTNPSTASALGDGYAKGDSVEGGFRAVDSPFGGTITLSGYIANPPDDPLPGDKLLYRVQYRKHGVSGWTDITNRFLIGIDTFNGYGWSSQSQYQYWTGGYYTYEVDNTGPLQHHVAYNILGQWVTPMPEGDGLYELRVLVRDPAAPVQTDVPPGHLVSNVIRVVVDNTAPLAEISLQAGSCTKYYSSDLIRGNFTATDKHIWQYVLYTLPEDKPLQVIPGSEVYPALTDPGVVNKDFTIITAGQSACGYVARLYIWDRTIVNNHLYGNQSTASVGFCLLE